MEIRYVCSKAEAQGMGELDNFYRSQAVLRREISVEKKHAPPWIGRARTPNTGHVQCAHPCTVLTSHVPTLERMAFEFWK